jgi:hypothetical protein
VINPLDAALPRIVKDLHLTALKAISIAWQYRFNQGPNNQARLLLVHEPARKSSRRFPLAKGFGRAANTSKKSPRTAVSARCRLGCHRSAATRFIDQSPVRALRQFKAAFMI